MDATAIDQKLLRAARSRGWTTKGLIQSTHIWLEQLAETEDAKPIDMDHWIFVMRRFHEQFELAGNDDDTRRRIEIEAMSDITVQDALRYLVNTHDDQTARQLLHFGADVDLLYDGDAARELLKQFSASCEEPYRSAVAWLAAQPCARHAFAASNPIAARAPATRKKNLSKLPKVKGGWLRKHVWKYWVKRFELLFEAHPEIFDAGRYLDFEFTPEESDLADKLLKKHLESEGKTDNNIRQIFSRLRNG